MMKRITFLSILGISLTGLAGCSSGEQQSETLVKANETHIEALAIAEQVEARLDSARKAGGEPAVIKTVDSLANLVEQWEEGLVEVPGFEHEHDHSAHEHEHNHKPTPQMTDESMLEFQVNAKEAILMIEGEVNKQFKYTKK